MHVIHLHYLNPFFEALRSCQAPWGAEKLGTLFTYRRLRAKETDPLFRRVVSEDGQSTWHGYLRILRRILKDARGEEYLLLVHQAAYQGPYAPLILAILAKGGAVRVKGPKGLEEWISPSQSPGIVAEGISFFLRRMGSVFRNAIRLPSVPLRHSLLLKRDYPRLNRVPFPTLALIEPTNLCNLRCPVCETGNRSLGRKRSMMSLPEFSAIADRLPSTVREVCLHINGESFLNPDIYGMLRYASDQGRRTFLDTNGLLMDPERVVTSGLDHINVCLDGDSQETYSLYRVGGDFRTLVENIRGLVEARKRARATRPRITLKVIAMRHTDSLIDRLPQVTSELGADDHLITLFTARECREALQYQSPRSEFSKYIPEELEAGRLVTRYIPSIRECQVPYYGLNVTAAGEVLPCCRDMEGKYVMGNLLEQPLEEIWNNSRFADFRSRLISMEIDICRECHLAVNNYLY
ncbi:MAG: SPASM domain-containing protein [Deltaproteobacteria bacterium]|nr:SPASM domain-containing protein [Deltaproteobacteria bacterium]